MAKRKPSSNQRPPARTDEGRETQLISLAFDLAEQQLLDGTASAQVITQLMKLGTSRESLEQERLRGENQLLRAKVEMMESAKNVEALYSEALAAMKAYSGQDDYSSDDFYDD